MHEEKQIEKKVVSSSTFHSSVFFYFAFRAPSAIFRFLFFSPYEFQRNESRYQNLWKFADDETGYSCDVAQILMEILFFLRVPEMDYEYVIKAARRIKMQKVVCISRF